MEGSGRDLWGADSTRTLHGLRDEALARRYRAILESDFSRLKSLRVISWRVGASPA